MGTTALLGPHKVECTLPEMILDLWGSTRPSLPGHGCYFQTHAAVGVHWYCQGGLAARTKLSQCPKNSLVPVPGHRWHRADHGVCVWSHPLRPSATVVGVTEPCEKWREHRRGRIGPVELHLPWTIQLQPRRSSFGIFQPAFSTEIIL